MFDGFTDSEIRDTLELMYAISYSDNHISEEEIAVLVNVASILSVSTDGWNPNTIDLDFLLKRIGEMEYSKVVTIITFITQLSVFDGEFSETELDLLLPIAAVQDISNNQLLKIVNNAIDGDEITEFDKIITFALVMKAMNVDGVVTSEEIAFLADLKERFKLSNDYINFRLVDNFDWVLRMMKTYSKKKLHILFEEVIKVLIADNEFHDEEISFLVYLASLFGIENDLETILLKVMGVSK